MLNREETKKLVQETALLIHYSEIDPKQVGEKLLDEFTTLKVDIELELCRIVAEDVASYYVTTLSRMTDRAEFTHLLQSSELVDCVTDYAKNTSSADGDFLLNRYVTMESWCDKVRLGQIEEMVNDELWQSLLGRHFREHLEDYAFLSGNTVGFDDTPCYLAFKTGEHTKIITVKMQASTTPEQREEFVDDVTEQFRSILGKQVDFQHMTHCKDEIVGHYGVEPSALPGEFVSTAPVRELSMEVTR